METDLHDCGRDRVTDVILIIVGLYSPWLAKYNKNKCKLKHEMQFVLFLPSCAK